MHLPPHNGENYLVNCTGNGKFRVFCMAEKRIKALCKKRVDYFCINYSGKRGQLLKLRHQRRAALAVYMQMCIRDSACLIVAVFTTMGVLQQAATTSAGERQLPIYCVQTEKKEIALTFDAAWGNSDTDELLALLEENGAKATFFCTGEWVDNYPDDVKRLFDAGHEIQNHSDKHPHPNELSFEALITDTQACDEKIHAITGVYPTLYRSPYGEYNDKVIQRCV